MSSAEDAVVVIEHIQLSDLSDAQELSALIDGERVWFRFPPATLETPRPDPFLAMGLQEAMVRGVALRLKDSVGIPRRLSTGLHEMQAVFVAWNDEDFQHVPVEALTTGEQGGRDWVMSAFSGGIDSSYTYVMERHAITHLLMVQGFDRDSDDASWRASVEAKSAFAAQEGKVLIPIATNARAFMESRRLSWSVLHGSLLASLGTAMRAKRIFIPSTFTLNELFPWGSHPLLDPLWSTDQTDVVHHGIEATRTQKTHVVASHQPTLDRLQVCWRHIDSNCGECPKCVRTSLALHLLGKVSANLPAYRGGAQLTALKPSNHASLAFTEDLIQFAIKHGDTSTAEKLKSYRRHFLVRFHLSELIKVYGARYARLISRRWARASWHDDRAKLQSTRTWLD